MFIIITSKPPQASFGSKPRTFNHSGFPSGLATCKNLVRFHCFHFFCKNLMRFYCFVCGKKSGAATLLFSISFCKNLVRFYCFFLLKKTWWSSIVVVFWVWQNMLSLNESKHSFYPAGNSCEKPRKTCLESPRPRFLRSSPFY